MSRVGRYVRASDLYDAVTCLHRVTLDREIDRTHRAPPTDTMRVLIERGLSFERTVNQELGWPSPRYEVGDFREGANATETLLREGTEGVLQGVLFDDDHLAIPDMLIRADGSSRLGSFHYEPGDIKTSFRPRSDEALQVAFAGVLLERVQGVAPERGHLILADGERFTFELAPLRPILDHALEQVRSAIAVGDTRPFFSPHCTSCRWRFECLPRLCSTRDLSLIRGMTPMRRQVLERHGVTTIEQLSTIDEDAWSESEHPTLGLRSLTRNARALSTTSDSAHVGDARRTVKIDGAYAPLWIESDPTRGANSLALLGWRIFEPDGVLRYESIATSDAQIESSLLELLEQIERDESLTPVCVSRSQATTLVNALEDMGIDVSRRLRAEDRLLDLVGSSRAPLLPAWRLDPLQIACALDGQTPLPELEETAAFAVRELRGNPDLLSLATDQLDRMQRWLAFLRDEKRRATGAA